MVWARGNRTQGKHVVSIIAERAARTVDATLQHANVCVATANSAFPLEFGSEPPHTGKQSLRCRMRVLRL